MEGVLVAAVIKSLGAGDIKGFLAYAAIFFVLWLEIRASRKTIKGLGEAIKGLGDSITTGFSAGEKRFEIIESTQKEFEHRLTVIEEH